MIAQNAAFSTLYDEKTNYSGLSGTNRNLDALPKLDKIKPENLLAVENCKSDPENLSVLKDKESDLKDTTFTRHYKAQYSFLILQEWEGYVVSISKETFTARLVDVTRTRSLEEEEADLPLDDLDDDARRKISPGAIFRWVIGYHRSPSGTKDRTSRIVFRDLPYWSKKEIVENRNEAAELASRLTVE